MDSRYYDGFEGEPSISFTTGDERTAIEIWNGFFDGLMDIMLEQNIPKEGMLKHYFQCDGWYDKSPWELKDVGRAIAQLEQVDLSFIKPDETLGRISLVPEITKEIIAFLKTALERNERVFMIYD